MTNLASTHLTVQNTGLVTLHDITLVQLQTFLQDNAMSLSQKFTVVFDTDDKSNNQFLDNAQTPPAIDFSQLPAFGMWADRQEMDNSLKYVQKLRQEHWG